MLTLFESRYTLKGRYNIGNVGKTASTSMLNQDIHLKTNMAKFQPNTQSYS